MANITLNIEECNTITPVNYGALYNWWAATDAREITSDSDWVVPDDDGCNVLITYIGGIAGKLKEIGLIYWNSPNTGATNEVGFNAKGVGVRGYDFDSAFDGEKYSTVYWSSTDGVTPQPIEARSFGLDYEYETTNIGDQTKGNGNSIRLLYTGAGTPTSYTGNDGKVYPVVLIGTQYWLAENLNETKYRNGDWITGFDNGVYTPISSANWAALTTEGMCYYNDDENNG